MNSILRSLVLSVQHATNGYDSLARSGNGQFGSPNLYPIFIIGAPRTGSTLVYQLMIKYMKVAFISNTMALLPKKMLSIAKFTHRQMSSIEDIKESDHGYIPGLFYPNEAGAVMRKWFDEEVEDEEKRFVRSTIIFLADVFGAPFVNKNLFNSIRLTHIHHILPEARYIYIRRNPLFTTQSILLERQRILGSEYEWLGPKPVGYLEVLEHSPLYQVLWQVKKLEDMVSEFLHTFSPTHLELTYESICQDTGETLELIADRFELEYKLRSNIDSLPVRNDIKISEAEWKQLQEFYSVLYHVGK